MGKTKTVLNMCFFDFLQCIVFLFSFHLFHMSNDVSCFSCLCSFRVLFVCCLLFCYVFQFLSICSRSLQITGGNENILKINNCF